MEEYKINANSFRFVHDDGTMIHDEKFSTKRIGYFKDAMHRFAKNKGSVVAAGIIFLLILFAILVALRLILVAFVLILLNIFVLRLRLFLLILLFKKLLLLILPA